MADAAAAPAQPNHVSLQIPRTPPQMDLDASFPIGEAEHKKLTKVQPPPPLTWREALGKGWTPEAGATKLGFYLREVLLGIIICMAQIPESIAFAYLARVRPPVALHAAWVVGLVCALLGGRPGMINGATGAFAAIVSTFLEEPASPGGNGAGVELLFPSVMLAGVFMVAVWLLRLDRFITMLPLPVMIGFCNGLAVVIGLAQLHPFHAPVCSAANATAAHRRLAGGPCTDSGWKEGAEMGFMVLIMLVAMLLMEFVPKIPKPSNPSKKPRWLRPFAYVAVVLLELPSSLLSIAASILLEFALVRPLGYRTDTIGDKEEFTAADALPKPFFLDDHYDLSVLGTGEAWGKILVQAVLLCAVGCIESLMTAEVVSGFTKTQHHSGLVVAAMGLANTISGFLGGMGGNAMIGLSTIACLNGGRGRVAPLCTALGILLCVSAAYMVLNYIPMAALAGVMIVVVMHTFKWFSLPMLLAAALPQTARARLSSSGRWYSKFVSMERKVVRADIAIMLAVSALVVLTNIVLAVGIGLGLSAAAFAWEAAKQLRVSHYLERDAHGTLVKVYEVEGPLFFAASRRFTEAFEVETDPENVVVLFYEGALYDYTLMDALVAVTAEYEAAGKKVAFHRLTGRSVRMLKKADRLTRQVEYRQEAADDIPLAKLVAAAAVDASGLEVKRRVVGLGGPGWTDQPGIPEAHAAEASPASAPEAAGVVTSPRSPALSPTSTPRLRARPSNDGSVASHGSEGSHCSHHSVGMAPLRPDESDTEHRAAF